jgi:hypothetical protein
VVVSERGERSGAWAAAAAEATAEAAAACAAHGAGHAATSALRHVAMAAVAARRSPLQPQLAAAAVRSLLALGVRCGAAALAAAVETTPPRMPLAVQHAITGYVPTSRLPEPLQQHSGWLEPGGGLDGRVRGSSNHESR